jgi:hypothetical protein
MASAAIGAIHLAAFLTMALTEADWIGRAVFLITWGCLNCFWLAVLRRPALSAALSLVMIALILALSLFKYAVVWMTLNFFDVLIVDPDTVAFLWTIMPDLRLALIVAALIGLPALVLVWRIDPFRVRRSVAALAGAACLATIAGVASAVPEEPSDQFHGNNHVSLFVRSAVWSVSSLVSHGWMELDDAVHDRLRTVGDSCAPPRKLPHIILVLDEASFDITAAPGIKVPPRYSDHFKSFDGKARRLLVEATGGPTWYAEYNVLTGLSARSFGRFSYYVTRIAAGRVERGLPQTLRRCGYRTFTLYPAYGAFLSARMFQTGVGIDRLIDSRDMKAGEVQPDSFYYDQAVRLIERQRGMQPLFVFAYTAANHFPWFNRYRPDLTPGWRDPGNVPEVDEYIRRQSMSGTDYRDFVAKLEREFPNDAFLIVRFGDHQPTLSSQILEPTLSQDDIVRKILANDPRYFTTYYAMDVVNFAPASLSSALTTLEAPYLPLVVQEAAGVPLDPSFAEQKRIFERCRGLFYGCAGGAEARRFNRLLTDAGLIKGMVSR